MEEVTEEEELISPYGGVGAGFGGGFGRGYYGDYGGIGGAVTNCIRLTNGPVS